MHGCVCFLLSVGLASCSWAPETFEQDFTSGAEIDPLVALVGDQAADHVRQEPGGLTIALPEGRLPGAEAGLSFNSRLSGDFEIELVYELLDVSSPQAGLGNGIKIWMRLDTQPPQALTLAHVIRPGGVNQFVAIFAPRGPGGGGHRFEPLAVEADAKAGHLKLVRQGGQVRYLVTEDETTAFREILTTPVAKDAVRDLRIVTSSGRGAGALEVRLRRIHVQAEDIEALLPGSGSFYVWLVVWGAVLLAVCVGGFLEWRNWRRGRARDAVSAVHDGQETPH